MPVICEYEFTIMYIWMQCTATRLKARNASAAQFTSSTWSTCITAHSRDMSDKWRHRQVTVKPRCAVSYTNLAFDKPNFLAFCTAFKHASITVTSCTSSSYLATNQRRNTMFCIPQHWQRESLANNQQSLHFHTFYPYNVTRQIKPTSQLACSS